MYVIFGPTGFHGIRLPNIPTEKATNWGGIGLFAEGPLFYQAFWELFMKSFQTLEMAFSLKTLAVWRGLLTSPELLFPFTAASLLYSMTHQQTSVPKQGVDHKQGRHPQSKPSCWPFTKNVILSLKCAMTKCAAFLKGHLCYPIPGRMEIIKPACKVVRVLKAAYLPKCSALANESFVSRTFSPLSRAAKSEEDGEATLYEALRSIPGLTPVLTYLSWLYLRSTVSRDVSLSKTHMSVWRVLGHRHHSGTNSLRSQSSRSCHMEYVWLHCISFDFSSATANNYTLLGQTITNPWQTCAVWCI